MECGRGGRLPHRSFVRYVRSVALDGNPALPLRVISIKLRKLTTNDAINHYSFND